MRQRVGLSLVVVGCALALVASSGFTTAEADRELSVAVADDDQAYVGYDAPATRDVVDGDEVRLVTVANRFHTGITVTNVEVAVSDDSTSTLTVDTSGGGSLGVGEEATIDAEITCEESVTDARVDVTVTVEGTNVSATVHGETETRTMSVDCEPATTIAAVRFAGQGNAEVMTASDTEAVFRVLLLTGDGKLYGETATLETNSPVRGQLDGAGGDRIVAISLYSAGGWYVHPAFDGENCTVDPPADGGRVEKPEPRPPC